MNYKQLLVEVIIQLNQRIFCINQGRKLQNKYVLLLPEEMYYKLKIFKLI